MHWDSVTSSSVNQYTNMQVMGTYFLQSTLYFDSCTESAVKIYLLNSLSPPKWFSPLCWWILLEMAHTYHISVRQERSNKYLQRDTSKIHSITLMKDKDINFTLLFLTETVERWKEWLGKIKSDGLSVLIKQHGKILYFSARQKRRTQSLQLTCFKNSAIRTLGHEFCLRYVPIIHLHSCYDYEASENLRFPRV